MDRAFLVALVNRADVNAELQALAYKLLNIPQFRPTSQECATLIAARLGVVDRAEDDNG
jgi:hypothetical protein